MIAYLFPPEGNAGVYRPLRFVQELAKRDWDTTVISGKPYRYERYDPELEDRIPGQTKVIRVRGTDMWQAFQARRARNFERRISSASNRETEEIRAAHSKPFRSRLRKSAYREASWYLPDYQTMIRRQSGAIELCNQRVRSSATKISRL
jgi:hypothetical protein